MSNAKMDANTIGKGLELVNNMSKLAANLSSDRKPQEKKPFKEDFNQPHNQTVEVKVGSEQQQKPVIVHEKKETHIHKPFPEGRSLTTEECEVEKMRIQTEVEDKKAEREYRMWLEEQNRKERKEREEYVRRERERRRQEDKKFVKRLGIAAGICTAIGVGLYAYNCYTGSRNFAGSRLAIPAPQPVNTTIDAEGTVK